MVLVTVFLMTMFLLVVDLFWGWLLSLSYVGVLPSKAETQQKQEQKDVRGNVCPSAVGPSQR